MAHLCTLFLDIQLILKVQSPLDSLVDQSHQYGNALTRQMDRTEVQGTRTQQEDLRSLGRIVGVLTDRGEFRGTLRDLWG